MNAAAKSWSEAEVEAIVADYFDMLSQELRGGSFNKAEHRRALMDKLEGRSGPSVEFKHANISAVLIEMGYPYIDGYKPRSNYQGMLVDAVSNFIREHPGVSDEVGEDADRQASVPSVEDILAALEESPSLSEKDDRDLKQAPPVYNPGGVNYLEREAKNQSLGDAGEQFVINFERARLVYAGREALAERIEQVSETIGPSAGYDIRSFEVGGADRFIEAKTTKYGKITPFFVTPNELRFSKSNTAQYYLYRVFRFRATPKLFTLQGNLENKCKLRPSQYVARPA